MKLESDIEIKRENEKRIKILEPKASLKAKCNFCRKFFEVEKRRFKERACQECRKKFQKRKENL